MHTINLYNFSYLIYVFIYLIYLMLTLKYFFYPAENSTDSTTIRIAFLYQNSFHFITFYFYRSPRFDFWKEQGSIIFSSILLSYYIIFYHWALKSSTNALIGWRSLYGVRRVFLYWPHWSINRIHILIKIQISFHLVIRICAVVSDFWNTI